MPASGPDRSTVTSRPQLRGWVHAAAFGAAVPATVWLIRHSESAGARAVAAVYAGILLLMLGTSSVYHRLPLGSGARGLLQRLDHSMIFVLIAGTYTPLCLAVLPLPWGVPVLAAVGVGATVGIVIKVVAFEGAGRHTGALYLVLGWAAIVAAPVLISELSTNQVVLFAAGGVAYTMGFPVLARQRPDPWPSTFGYHEIWHVFTVVAVACHFAGVATIVT